MKEGCVSRVSGLAKAATMQAGVYTAKCHLEAKQAVRLLDQIMMDAHSNPRHKIEAIKELRQTAIGNSPESLPESERFIITINLGEGHVEHYDKPIKPIKPIKIEADGDSSNNLIPLEGKPDADE